jgi:CRP-like cAMP-binding protein
MARAGLQNNPVLSERCTATEEDYLHRPLWQFREREPIPLGESDIWLVVRGVVALGTSHASGEGSLVGLVGPDLPFGRPLSSLTPYEARALTQIDLQRLSFSEIERSAELS